VADRYGAGMTAIPLDQSQSPIRLVPQPRQATSESVNDLRFIHVRMVGGRVTAKEPTAFGSWLLSQMDSRDLSQTDLAKRIGITQPTVSRWIYRQALPETAPLTRLADQFGLNDAERVELFRLAGHSVTVAPVAAGTDGQAARPTHALAVEIQAMLSTDSPIPEEDRRALENLLELVVHPYRKVMQRGKTA
jgi:transcriptional regulator with XRE-family HTH domain